jgi:predicted component of type VI protein secretion system
MQSKLFFKQVLISIYLLSLSLSACVSEQASDRLHRIPLRSANREHINSNTNSQCVAFALRFD